MQLTFWMKINIFYYTNKTFITKYTWPKKVARFYNPIYYIVELVQMGESLIWDSNALAGLQRHM